METAAPAEAGFLDLFDNFLTAAFEQRLGAVPIAAGARASQSPIALPVKIGENPVLVLQQQSSPAADVSWPAVSVNEVAPGAGMAPVRPAIEPGVGTSSRASASSKLSVLS